MKVLAFAASNSRNSINKALISYAVTLLPEHEVEVLDINDYPLPIFSVDLEQEQGIPEVVGDFLDKIAGADALLISFAEHNANYTVAYKNLFDWATRKQLKVYQGKPIIMLSTSPGKGGAGNVLAMARTSAPYFGGTVAGALAIPAFFDNFDTKTNRLTNTELDKQLRQTLQLPEPQ
ncbi:NADPH-dependent FMN reductase [Planctobacterium marinum]|uniref:NADPH-dependent FMN reductase n=1 Tax=Planctobacterium marinum TaxID=1631968 RepID=UPI001E55E512|nr:NADPH-dependent FMN reductase [Planctobacterium marinum]MCC2606956.1 NAD(P)H-dependent oxidoreductase [Planctobacterium marinum]